MASRRHVASGLILLTPVAGASETRALSVKVPLRETVFNECEGFEPIRLSGVVHLVLRVVVDESHGELDIHDVEHTNWERVRGVGQETGASYVVNETFNNVLERKDPERMSTPSSSSSASSGVETLTTICTGLART